MMRSNNAVLGAVKGFVSNTFCKKTVLTFLVGCTAGPLFAQSEQTIGTESAPPSRELLLDSAILKTIESTSVSAQVTGLLGTLSVKEGSKVKSDQEIGRVLDGLVRLQMEKARVSYDVAKKKQKSEIDKELASKNRAVAENEYQRAVDANKQVKDVYPLNELDRLKLLFDRAVLESDRALHQQEMAALEVSLAEIEYKQSLELLQRHRILAPCDGVVVSVERRVGEWLEPGTVLLKIVRTDRLRIEGFLQAIDAAPELIGSIAHVTLEGIEPPIETKAELVFISPDANPLNSQVRVYLEVDNSQGLLRPGLRPKTVIQRVP
jgi:multidrug efflux pump subunit AcrA (membrane-fusion protein)